MKDTELVSRIYSRLLERMTEEENVSEDGLTTYFEPTSSSIRVTSHCSLSEGEERSLAVELLGNSMKVTLISIGYPPTPEGTVCMCQTLYVARKGQWQRVSMSLRTDSLNGDGSSYLLTGMDEKED